MQHYQRIHLCMFKPVDTIEATVRRLLCVVGNYNTILSNS